MNSRRTLIVLGRWLCAALAVLSLLSLVIDLALLCLVDVTRLGPAQATEGSWVPVYASSRRSGHRIGLTDANGRSQVFSCEAPVLFWTSGATCIPWRPEYSASPTQVKWVRMPGPLSAGEVMHPVEMRFNGEVVYATSPQAFIDAQVERLSWWLMGLLLAYVAVAAASCRIEGCGWRQWRLAG